MDALEDALRVVEAFNVEGVDYVVVGGVALNADAAALRAAFGLEEER